MKYYEKLFGQKTSYLEIMPLIKQSSRFFHLRARLSRSREMPNMIVSYLVTDGMAERVSRYEHVAFSLWKTGFKTIFKE